MRKEHIFKDEVEYKECSSCKKVKKIERFSKNKLSWDGLKPYCKECASKKGKAYREDNREDDLKRKRAWYRNSKKKAQQRTENELAIREKVCSKCNKKLDIKEYRERPNGGFYSICKHCDNKRNAIYRKNNNEFYKAIHRKTESVRRERKKLVISNFSNDEWKYCKEYFDGKCAYCGEDAELTMDYVKPLSKMGNYSKDNIVPACTLCNCKKSNKNFLVWYKEQEFYSEERLNKIQKYLSSFK
ncbi:HNH endonuclease signature motif containing protein [Clostridium baratii]|uniref:HNH endonuclease n=1 Tax=Clostridium baratii TaxID=1561 RepID=UPI0030D47037